MMSDDEVEEPQVETTAVKAKALPKSRGTGFEAYFADAPMTPAEAAYEKENIYSPDRPLSERIEACITRFRASRRFPNDLRQYFNHYLFLGGIDSEQRQFTGVSGMSKQELEEMTPDEIRDQSAVDTVHRGKSTSAKYYHEGDEHWEVDFTGIAAGFFSEYLPNASNLNFEEMTKAVNLIDNFLHYVLHHDVCPEHAEDIRNAIALCETARVDLPLAYTALIQFPGQFSLACTELFCEDNPPFTPRDNPKAFRRPEDFNAKLVFQVCVMFRGDDEQIKRIVHENKYPKICVTDERHVDMKVVAIGLPTENIRKEFKRIHTSDTNKTTLAAFGTAVLEPCVVEEGWDYGPNYESPTQEEREASRKTFILDDKILTFLRPGMTLRLIVCDLNIGISFIKSAMHILVPWYTFLPQTLMQGFKDPCPNPRPAPSAENPDDEDDDLDDEGDD